MFLSKTIKINIDLLYNMCYDKYFLELKYIIPVINDYMQRKIRNINTTLNKLEKINISKNDCIKYNESLFKIDKSIILRRYVQKIRNKINNKNIIIPEITFDRIIEDFIGINYKSYKIINITTMNANKIKNYKKNIKETTILIKLHKENKDVCSINTKNFTFQIINNSNYKNVIDRLLTNEFKCCACFDVPLDKSSFYICEICHIITCKNCLNEMYLKKNPDCACCVDGHNEILCPQCKSKIEKKVKNMLVEYIGFCYYPNFKKCCIAYKKGNIEIVRDIIENKIICLIYFDIAIEFDNIRYKDIENINFEKIINEENPTTERKPFLLVREE